MALQPDRAITHHFGHYTLKDALTYGGETGDLNSIHRDPQAVLEWCKRKHARQPSKPGGVIFPGSEIQKDFQKWIPGLLYQISDGITNLEMKIAFHAPLFTNELLTVNVSVKRVVPSKEDAADRDYGVIIGIDGYHDADHLMKGIALIQVPPLPRQAPEPVQEPELSEFPQA